MALDISKHPCFNEKVRATHGRIHLPIAPRCNIQCRYCNRDFDCANESRPGVTSIVLKPKQAVSYLEKALERDPRLSVVGIAGPGDPFANSEETMETLRLVREKYPDILLCVSTNGLEIGPHIEELANLEVGHVTITINAVDPTVGEKVYSWMRYRKRVHRSEVGAALLLERQLNAIKQLAELGVTVKVNTILIPGINEDHVEKVAEKVASLGATIFNLIPLYPVAGTVFEGIEEPSAEALEAKREVCERHIQQMRHCGRCRADDVGLIGELLPEVMRRAIREAAVDKKPLFEPSDPISEIRPYVAIGTCEGILVNRHLGESTELAVYRRDENGGYTLIEYREMPPKGGGDDRWRALAERLDDCRALLVSGIGPKPAAILRETGIQIAVMEGLVLEGLDAIFEDRELRSPSRCGHTCGSGCAGTATGCG